MLYAINQDVGFTGSLLVNLHMTKKNGLEASPRRIGPRTPNKALPRATHRSIIGGGMERFFAKDRLISGSKTR